MDKKPENNQNNFINQNQIFQKQEIQKHQIKIPVEDIKQVKDFFPTPFLPPRNLNNNNNIIIPKIQNIDLGGTISIPIPPPPPIVPIYNEIPVEKTVSKQEKNITTENSNLLAEIRGSSALKLKPVQVDNSIKMDESSDNLAGALRSALFDRQKALGINSG